MKRAALSTLIALALALVLAPAALAARGGEGLYGKTDDKVITNFGFGLMVFFTVVVIGFTIAQSYLAGRKSRK